MARISGVSLPTNKQIETALTYIHGIGLTSSRQILDKARVGVDVRVKDLSDAEISRLQQIVADDYLVEGERQRLVTGNIKRLKDIRAYRGARHQAKLPSRGQRTRTNARTRRGRKVTVGGTAKKTATKT